jgi:hypothetical protein
VVLTAIILVVLFAVISLRCAAQRRPDMDHIEPIRAEGDQPMSERLIDRPTRLQAAPQDERPHLRAAQPVPAAGRGAFPDRGVLAALKSSGEITRGVQAA